jgi:hypothetical protein
MLAPPTSLAQVYLAGFAAEHILTGRRPRQYDVETGLAILAHTDPTLTAKFDGLRTSDGYGAVLHLLRTGARPEQEELRREVDALYEIARASVSAVWSSVTALAAALLRDEELDRDGVDGVLGDADIQSPVFAVQRAHGLLPGARPVAASTEDRVVETTMSSNKKQTPAGSDQRVAALLKALRRIPALAPVVDAYERQAGERGSPFGKNGLKTSGGKLFALFTQGTLVVKLPKERVVALVDEGMGKPFDPGHGRLMKEWLTVTNPRASWVELTKEAFAFVGGKR